jgi:hypothetical protein
MNFLAISVSKLAWGVISIHGTSHKWHGNPRCNIYFSYIPAKKRSACTVVPTFNDVTGYVDVRRCISVTPRILNLRTGWGKAVSLAPRQFNLQYPTASRRFGPLNWFGNYGEWKLYDPCQETNSIYRLCIRESSPYTDWATSTNRTVLNVK